jgi:hypothetical protein
MAAYRKQRESDTRSVEEILKDKSFKPVHFYALFIKTTLSGDPINVISHPEPFEQIILSNVSVSRDKCYPSNPSKSGVELYGRSVDVKKSKVNEQRCSISSLEISCVNKSDRFFILVDGESYGPFYRALFVMDDPNRAARGDTTVPRTIGETLGHNTLSFQTFFPISL